MNAGGWVFGLVEGSSHQRAGLIVRIAHVRAGLLARITRLRFCRGGAVRLVGLKG